MVCFFKETDETLSKHYHVAQSFDKVVKRNEAIKNLIAQNFGNQIKLWNFNLQFVVC